MQNAEWIALFRQLPTEVHHQLVLVAQNRSDYSVESIFRLEPSYIVIRGRQGGTTDSGLLFVLPYDQIAAVCINREVKETEIQTLFGAGGHQKLSPSHQGSNIVRLNGSHQGTAVKPLTPSATAAAPATTAAAPAAVAPSPTANIRNNLLERLRAARNAALPPQANGKP